ncbi:MAG: beta-ketoacyl synthase [Chitinophagaceae bacterium]|nr:beta-ketoacyl synthase [Chitinophagaceae bacterium]HMN32914.1 beta-ketoacyl synthase N-terminal-like domain-containing protein [Chitinophagaceae bacterium]
MFNHAISIIDTAFISPLGLNTEDNFQALLNEKSSIRKIDDPSFYSQPILTSIFDDAFINQLKIELQTETRFDTILLKCAESLKQKSTIDFQDKKTLFILSTTKGNVELLDKNEYSERLLLSFSAKKLQSYFNNPNEVIIVSNACISGVSASIIAKRFLDYDDFNHVVVLGCDVVTKFVLSGFQSFKAISKNECKPFDKNRDGVVLGEASGAIIFSKKISSEIQFLGGSISNDANHISGPSKTGEELAFCINNALQNANITHDKIDFVMAHGTATHYNDEMESKAISLNKINNTPVVSIKGNYGHTLGASGIIEMITAVECMKHGLIFPSYGFEEKGISGDILVNSVHQKKEINYALKTTSGFGGCNAAAVLAKSQSAIYY